jgi:hypothetical protein
MTTIGIESMKASAMPVTALVASGSNQHDAGLAGRAGIAFGSMSRSGLVADEDVADLFMLEQRVVDRQHRAAGVAEDIFDPLTDQAFHQYVGAAALFAHFAIPLLLPVGEDLPPEKDEPGTGDCAGLPLQYSPVLPRQETGAP